MFFKVCDFFNFLVDDFLIKEVSISYCFGWIVEVEYDLFFFKGSCLCISF